MPTREFTIRKAIELLNESDYPDGLNERNYGLGIYQVLLWYEDIGFPGIDRLPHIIDADKLRPPSYKRKRGLRKGFTVWQRRAIDFERYLADRLGVNSLEVPGRVDRLLRSKEFEGLQRQNSLGIAFAGLIADGIRRYSENIKDVSLEVPSGDIFPGIRFPGRSKNPSADIVLSGGDSPLAIISAKWSVRHDRINDITNECPVYKAAAFRQSRTVLNFFVVTNEFDPSRLAKIMADDCIDGTIHVDKLAVTEICGLDGRLSDLIDLADFYSSLNGYIPCPGR